MTITESQLEAIAAPSETNMVIFDGQFEVIFPLLRTKYGGQLEVVVTLRGPSMIITESQLKAIAAPSETKHGDL